MGELEEAKDKAAAAYNAAADYFDHPVSSFWHRFGRQTIERLGLSEGETVLDVCCGSGGSALPAAEAVGPKGKVVAVDLAERLVQLGEAKARAKGLGNIHFKSGDMLALGYPTPVSMRWSASSGFSSSPTWWRPQRNVGGWSAQRVGWLSPHGGRICSGLPIQHFGRRSA